jgi:DNA-binding PadR family transcriptional regulator
MRGHVGKTDDLQGALDLLILNTLALAPNHGWGIQQRMRQVSREALNVSQGSLYPALHRLGAAGLQKVYRVDNPARSPTRSSFVW